MPRAKENPSFIQKILSNLVSVSNLLIAKLVYLVITEKWRLFKAVIGC